jgi:hypothetical protein
MRPGVSAAHVAAVAKTHVQYATLLSIDIDANPARLHSGFGLLVVDDVEYIGIGQLGRIASLEGTLTGRVNGAQYELSGVNTPEGIAIIDALTAAGNSAEQVDVTLSFALFDPVAGTAIGKPIVLRDDRFNTFSVIRGDGAAVLELYAEPPGTDRNRKGPRVWSPEDQQTYFPGDTGLDRQPRIGLSPVVIGTK